MVEHKRKRGRKRDSRVERGSGEIPSRESEHLQNERGIASLRPQSGIFIVHDCYQGHAEPHANTYAKSVLGMRLTEALGSDMAWTNLRDAAETDRMVSVRPALNRRVDPLSYIPVSFPYSLQANESENETYSAVVKPHAPTRT